MKKCILALVILLSLLQAAAAAGEQKIIGALSYLNLSEEEYSKYIQSKAKAVALLSDNGYITIDPSLQVADSDANGIQVIFYESLGEMLMDISSGKINEFIVPQSTAEYLCARNHELFRPIVFDNNYVYKDKFEEIITERMSDGFAFMMMEYNRSLKDEFDTAIAAMKEDGTITELIHDHIQNLLTGGSAPQISLEQKEGRETITVAITGSLPPMDYVGPDGNFSGFNAAILAEIGRRLDKNIEFIQVDNVGRSLALVSGKADAAFWTRSTPNPHISEMSDEEYAAYIENLKAAYTEEENEVMRLLSEALSRGKLDRRDIPEGCIITEPYYIDISVPVMLRNR